MLLTGLTGCTIVTAQNDPNDVTRTVPLLTGFTGRLVMTDQYDPNAVEEQMG